MTLTKCIALKCIVLIECQREDYDGVVTAYLNKFEDLTLVHGMFYRCSRDHTTALASQPHKISINIVIERSLSYFVLTNHSFSELIGAGLTAINNPYNGQATKQ